MSALERYRKEVEGERYLVQYEGWFRAAMYQVIRGELPHHPRYREAPAAMQEEIARRLVSTERRDLRGNELHIVDEAERAVHSVIYQLRRAGIIPVPVKGD